MTAKKPPKPKKLWALTNGFIGITAAAHTKGEARALFKDAGLSLKGVKVILVKEGDS